MKPTETFVKGCSGAILPVNIWFNMCPGTAGISTIHYIFLYNGQTFILVSLEQTNLPQRVQKFIIVKSYANCLFIQIQQTNRIGLQLSFSIQALSKVYHFHLEVYGIGVVTNEENPLNTATTASMFERQIWITIVFLEKKQNYKVERCIVCVRENVKAKINNQSQGSNINSVQAIIEYSFKYNAKE